MSKEEIKKTNRLTNLESHGVDLVDAGAIEKRFLIIKRDENAGIRIEKTNDNRKLPTGVLIEKEEPKTVDIGDVAETLNDLIQSLQGKEKAPTRLHELLVEANKIVSGESETQEPKSPAPPVETPAVEPAKVVAVKDVEPPVETPAPTTPPAPAPESSTTPVENEETVHPSPSAEPTPEPATDAEREAFLTEAIDRELADIEAGEALLAEA